LQGIDIYTTSLYFKYNELQKNLLPLLLERVGGEENKITRYIPHPSLAPSLRSPSREKEQKLL